MAARGRWTAQPAGVAGGVEYLPDPIACLRGAEEVVVGGRLEEALWRGVPLAKPAAQLGDGRRVMKFAVPGASGSVAVDELGTV